MAKNMKIITVGSFILTVLFIIIYKATDVSVFFTFAITTGTISYHFSMRLLVGFSFNSLLHNRVDYTRKWFRVGKTEQKIYAFLKVKQWKKHLPTFDPDTFDKSIHSWVEIAMAMCQSELVHETIVVLSFLPIIAFFWFGALPVFVCTSVLSAIFDLMFVMIQRYNRPRVLKLIK